MVIKERFTVRNEERNVDARSLLVLPVTASFARRGDSKAALSGHSFPHVSLLCVAQTCTTLIVYFVGSDALFNRNSKLSLRRIGGVIGSQALFKALSISNRKCGGNKKTFVAFTYLPSFYRRSGTETRAVKLVWTSFYGVTTEPRFLSSAFKQALRRNRRPLRVKAAYAFVVRTPHYQRRCGWSDRPSLSDRDTERSADRRVRTEAN